MHFHRNGRHFEYCSSFRILYKLLFLIPNKAIIDSFIGLLQEINFSQSDRGHLKLAAIATLKQKIIDGNIPGITEYI